MKDAILQLVQHSLTALQHAEVLPAALSFDVQLTACKDPAHGDYATNCALQYAKEARLSPRSLAEQIKLHLPPSSVLAAVEIAGPGFINFRIHNAAAASVVGAILQQKQQFGRQVAVQPMRVHLEFVSANPTGPLHVGHGRGAAYGACVANLLEAIGHSVHKEYYVNDAGRQMRILAVSVWLRYLLAHSLPLTFPEGAYQGDYIRDIALQLVERYQDRFLLNAAQLEGCPSADDMDQLLDLWVDYAEQILGPDDFQIIFKAGLSYILSDIRDDLAAFGVEYDQWFHESALFDQGLIDSSIALLAQHGFVYEKDGARWFKATNFGDEKDRVLVRANGVTTYFASDVAYHLYKYQQGYDQIIDIFGADHHGYIARIQAFLQGLGQDPSKVTTLLVQFAALYRGKTKIAMTTRGGQFVTLRQLREEVGVDAARFFYIMRKREQHLDFDLELAQSQSSENPVYYIQYAHARIVSVEQQLVTAGFCFDQAQGLAHLDQLTTAYEMQLLACLRLYPERLQQAAEQYAPHTLAFYLQDLAVALHSYYNNQKFIVADDALRNARLCLIAATRQVIANGLALLGICAPDQM